jgi:arsenite methyltransferase
MTQPKTDPLTLNDFEVHDGIYFPKDSEMLANSKTKPVWENAAESWVKTGYASGMPGGLWEKLPSGKHYNSILDIGCGYGRHGFYLSQHRQITCDQYYGIDISEKMLRRLLKVKQEQNFFSTAEFCLICMPVEQLPIADNSVDFVISSSVFIHLDKQVVKNILSEVYRVLKPGGVFYFDDSFYNKYCPANVLRNLSRSLVASDVNRSYLQQYSFSEIQQELQASQLTLKCPDYTIQVLKTAILPDQLKGTKVPLAKTLNSIKPPEVLKGFLASTYSVYSNNLFAGID